ncbi:hypothetical protein GTY87_35110 [Streptomyces sp. SID7813]|uniref:Uncharacterized protein n=1 Tax=Streptomyces coelicolor (strain ATCC BAA-471 / A3(2) / M145) TaxID=100226 RepID=Q9L1P2_STRCO|nr:hypothetical protein [Streptomyces sp. SID7813]QFI46652.1 hypothetical protein FQ762_35455 [Streptomyces coelicolor A3(2)]CAB72378.1 hypothetical protein SC7F9.25c [Streptomyces coelicolor A3(2)]
MPHPPHVNATQWAAAQHRQAELDALTAQVAGHEAKKEHDPSAACDNCALDRDQVPEPETGLTHRPTPRHRSASRRRSRGR